MNFLDVRTVMISQFITDALGTGVLILLWLQNRKRYAGLSFWVVDFLFQTTTAVLLILRGSIPDWLSIGFTTFLGAGGAYLGLVGLQRFLGKKSSQTFNLIFFILINLVHLYFAFIQPNLSARNFNFSVGLLFYCAQCAWLLLRRRGLSLAGVTRAVGWVFTAFCVVISVRMVVILAFPGATNDFFKSGLYDTLILMSYQILLIMLGFGLALMVNQRLLLEVSLQEEKFTKAFHSSPYAILITRLSDGLILDVNRGFEKMTGYESAEVVGKRTLDLPLWVRETDRQSAVVELSDRGQLLGKEFQFRTKSGMELTCLFSAEILEMENDLYVLSSINDITARKKAEEELRENRAILQAALDQSPAGIAIADAPDGKLRYVNQAGLRIRGGDHQTIVDGIGIDQYVPVWQMLDLDGTSLAADEAPLARAILFGETCSRELIIRRGADDDRIVIANAAPIQDDSGKTLAAIVVFTDITERKQAEYKLKQSEERYRELVEHASDGIFIADASGKYIDVNTNGCAMLGYTRAEILQKSMRDLVAPAELTAKPLKMDDLLAGKTVITERQMICKDGSLLAVEISAKRLPDGSLQGIVRDIRERKRSEEELQRILEELKRSNTELEQFAYVASHDLQEPLRMVTSYMALIQRRYQGQLDQNADEFIAFAVDGAERAQRLINDLLAYSRVGRQGQPFKPTACESVLEHALDNLQLAIEDQHAQVTHDPLPVVNADETQLVQLFQNLIANAIKFHGAENPLVHISVEEKKAEWVFAVRDNGIGIDPQYADRIFVIFQRLNERSRYPGTGIGLAVCKKIVQRHGGRIWVEATPGSGSTFYFTLPKTRAESM